MKEGDLAFDTAKAVHNPRQRRWAMQEKPVDDWRRDDVALGQYRDLPARDSSPQAFEGEMLNADSCLVIQTCQDFRRERCRRSRHASCH